MLKEIFCLFIISIYVSQILAVCVTSPIFERRGGISDASISDPNVIEASNYAIGSKYGSAASYKLISAQQQVVAGIRYFLKVQFTFSGQQCSIQLIYQSWLNKYIIESNVCNGGGPYYQMDIEDQTIIDQTNLAIARLYGYDRKYQLESAQRVSVNGYIFTLIVRFPDSGEDCKIEIYTFINSQEIRLNTCSGAPSSLGFYPPTDSVYLF